MSRGVNKFIGIGNLGRDPETRFTQGGDAVTNFSIAINESYKNKQGEQVDKVEWVNCVTFGRLAEIAAEFLRKGSAVYVEGKMQTDAYEQDGVKKYATKINVRELQMLGGKAEQTPQGNVKSDIPAQDDLESDIPF